MQRFHSLGTYKGQFPPLSKGVNRMAQEVSYQPFQFKTVAGIISIENLSRGDKQLTTDNNCFATKRSPLLQFLRNRPLDSRERSELVRQSSMLRWAWNRCDPTFVLSFSGALFRLNHRLRKPGPLLFRTSP